MILPAMWNQQNGRFLLWVDGEDGALLKLEPLIAAAQGPAYTRDPGVGTTVVRFDVDPAAPDADGNLVYVLSLAGFLSRVDYKFDGYDLNDLSIPAAGGSSFNQPSINAPAAALCDRGDGTVNRFFQQVNLFATLFRHRRTVVASGIPTPFPPLGFPWYPTVESPGVCGAYLNMNFGACAGYRHRLCPDFSDGTLSQANLLNFAHDNTMIAHELGHNITQHLTFVRDPSWCGQAICPVPAGWLWFHDLADAWGAHLESTDCIGGLGGEEPRRDEPQPVLLAAE